MILGRSQQSIKPKVFFALFWLFLTYFEVSLCVFVCVCDCVWLYYAQKTFHPYFRIIALKDMPNRCQNSVVTKIFNACLIGQVAPGWSCLDTEAKQGWIWWFITIDFENCRAGWEKGSTPEEAIWKMLLSCCQKPKWRYSWSHRFNWWWRVCLKCL